MIENRNSKSILSGVLLLLCATQLVRPADQIRVHTVATESLTIFLAEIKTAEPESACGFFHKNKRGSCVTKVHTQILRIFKRQAGVENVETDFTIAIHQSLGVSAIGGGETLTSVLVNAI